MTASFFRYVWRHSRREQLIVLSYVLASLPFYWWSLEIPKRIVNEAIQGEAFREGHMEARLFDWSLSLPSFLGGHSFRISDGVWLQQFHYLYALSGLFLVLTLVNGWFKYVINIRKGVLGERMLRRLRFELYALLMRFRPEDLRTVKSAEVSSMIKDEVEPIGGFFGEALITPALLGAQATTAMIFIFAQEAWLGGIAFALILVQGIVIPYLRREQIRLGRERQIESRKLAGRIGEFVDAAPALHNYGVTAYSAAEIGDRLGVLFDIRLRLYRRKFAVKFLNNLLAQLTPFVFYIVGGYLALNGRLDIGQLVAVIAAYRDLPGPIKELIDWDQLRADVTVKYEQVVGQFWRDDLVPEEEASTGGGAAIAPDAPIVVSGLKIVSGRGIALLDRVSVTLPRPAHIALVGAVGSGRDILPKVLGRQISDYRGGVALGDRDFARMGDGEASRLLLYASSDPQIMSGTIRDNLCLPLRRRAPSQDADSASDATQRSRRREAQLTGNPLATPDGDWIDYAAIGLSGPDSLNAALVAALRVVRGYDEIFNVGMSSRIGDDPDGAFGQRLVEARKVIVARFEERGLLEAIEQFRPREYTFNATIAQNLLFGVSVGARFDPENMPEDPFVASLLAAEALVQPLVSIGARMAETVAEALHGMPSDSPLRERYSFIDQSELDLVLPALQANWRGGGKRHLPLEARRKLIGFALMYVEPRHRLNLMTLDLQRRILRARASFHAFLPAAEAGDVEFYRAGRIMPAASIRDNLLRGVVRYGKSHMLGALRQTVTETLDELGLTDLVVARGLDQEAGPGGRLLAPHQRAMIQLARILIRRPDICILDNAFAGMSAGDARLIRRDLLEALAGRTVIATLTPEDDLEGFDMALIFEGASLVETKYLPPRTELEPGGALHLAGGART